MREHKHAAALLRHHVAHRGQHIALLIEAHEDGARGFRNASAREVGPERREASPRLAQAAGLAFGA